MNIDMLNKLFYARIKQIFLIIVVQTLLAAMIYHSALLDSKFKPTSINCTSINHTIRFEEQRTLLLNITTDEQLEKALSSQKIQNGGCWSPSDCVANSRVAILIPFLNREENLNIFMLNMHPLFAKKRLSYCIYLIEPIANITFNRGVLMNIGFVESIKDSKNTWDCHAYHDVDLISENEYTPYDCPEYPTHLADKISKQDYRRIYGSYFGGVSIMRKEHYIKANGYSNLFFGWGGEDDDHLNRVLNVGLQVIRFADNSSLGRYTSLSHKRDKPNPERYEIFQNGKNRYNVEGLNSLVYGLVKIVKTKFYTKFYVYYNRTLLLERNNTNPKLKLNF